MKIAIYPGSFDPVTKGHEDIIKRASEMFDILYVVVLGNPAKKTLFTVDERVELIENVISDLDNVKADSSHALAITYAKEKNAKFIVRGLRATDDFEYELNIFAFNQHIEKEIDTIFLMTKLHNSFISSSGVKEMASYNANIDGLVSPCVKAAIHKKYEAEKGNDGICT
ncbi:pantetheine-phosphate adenylyltransferase [Mycoplasma sp. P36-A1]|uniref:pantetheine-phosphate adenylyltransferase n=1 Tax=Mycoplasma sp. P36-A1 TaxID=3252900 RepID=UPI003C2E00DC